MPSGLPPASRNMPSKKKDNRSQLVKHVPSLAPARRAGLPQHLQESRAPKASSRASRLHVSLSPCHLSTHHVPYPPCHTPPGGGLASSSYSDRETSPAQMPRPH